MAILLEICVDDPAGIAAAVAGGADRLELCAGLEVGGLTPSAALIECAVAAGLPVQVMVRPRAGGFVLEEGEADLIIADIQAALARGAAGVVVGALTADGLLDVDALAGFREAARGAAITLHRAIDLTVDPVAAVGVACTLGYDAILTSGGGLSASAGSATIRRMVETANGRLAIMAGGGVRPDTVGDLIAVTGVRAVHGSASRLEPQSRSRAAELAFGFGARRRTDRDTVAVMRAIIDQLEETPCP